MTIQPRHAIGICAALLLGACALMPSLRQDTTRGGLTSGQTGAAAVANARISGTVRLLGEPEAAGIQVTAYPNLAPPDGPSYSATTDARGAFTIAAPEGTYNLVARKPGLPYRAIKWHVQTGTIVDVDLVPTGGIRGTVTTTTSPAPDLTGAQVFVPGTDIDAHTDAAGTYAFTEVPIGTYSIAVSFRGYGLVKVDDVAVEAGATTTAPAIRLQPSTATGTATGSLEGRAYLVDLADSSGIQVEATFAQSPATPMTVMTASDGKYLFPSLPSTVLNLTYSKAGYGKRSVSVPVFVQANQLQQVDPITLLPAFGQLVTVVGPDLGGSETAAVPVFNSVMCRWDNDLFLGDAFRTSRIKKIGIAGPGGPETVLAGSAIGFADGTDARFSGISAIVADGYGTMYIADTENHRIRKMVLATGVVSTIAGNGTAGFADGLGVWAQFNYPRGLALIGTNLLVADSTNFRIRRIDLTSGTVTTFAGSGLYGSSDGTGSGATLAYPWGLALDGSYLYVTQSNNSAYSSIRQINTGTAAVTTLAGQTAGYADGTGGLARFNYPRGIVADGNGNLFVADYNNNRIRKVAIATAEVTTLSGSGDYGFVDGASDSAHFANPGNQLAIHPDGSLLVADSNNVVRKVDVTTGAVSTLTMTASARIRPVYGGGGLAERDSYIYFADPGSHRIRRFDTGTLATVTFAGGLPGFSDLASPQLLAPTGLTLDSNGNLYFSDSRNNRVRNSNPGYRVVAGSARGWADGVGTAASFDLPMGLAADGAGNLYVADRGNACIRKIVLGSGEVSTVAGSVTSGYADGNGSAAKFRAPMAVALDGAGSAYVADMVNDRIRKIDLATREVTTVAGGDNGYADGTGTAARFDRPSGVVCDGKILYIADQENAAIRMMVLATGQVSTLVKDSGMLLPESIALGASGSLLVMDRAADTIFRLPRAQ